jgi:hypothetical protein
MSTTAQFQKYWMYFTEHYRYIYLSHLLTEAH